MSFKFSFIYLLPLYIFWISIVFVNEVLQGFDDFSYLFTSPIN
jgi:hypothetical protein